MRKIAIITIFLFSFISCTQPHKKVYQSRKILMGTVFEIKAYLPAKIKQKQFYETAQKAFGEISRLESQMSTYNPESIISQVNENAGIKPVKVTDEITEVIASALEISAKTDGAFDITFAPLGKLWDVKNRKIPPSKKEIEKTKKLVNYNNIVLDKKNKTLFLTKKGMSIGLGGIAKGYAAKKAGEILSAEGIENFIINAGGDLYFKGNKGGKLWTSAIKNPEKKSKNILSFEIKNDVAVVTSGDYERFFIYKGKKYHHIINPHTGYPAQGIKSVTVFAENPTLADAYATAFFVMGYGKSLEVVQKTPDVAFIITDAKNCILSPNIRKLLKWLSFPVCRKPVMQEV